MSYIFMHLIVTVVVLPWRLIYKEVKARFFLKLIYFLTLQSVSEYSQLTMLWQFQVHSKVTQGYIYMYPFSPKLPSHLGCHRALSRVACAVQQMVIHFKYSSVYLSFTKQKQTHTQTQRTNLWLPEGKNGKKGQFESLGWTCTSQIVFRDYKDTIKHEQ